MSEMSHANAIDPTEPAAPSPGGSGEVVSLGTPAAPAVAGEPEPSGFRAEIWELIKIAAPTIATMVSYTLMQFVDGLMVSKITPADPVYLTAQGNGAVWAFTPISFVMGLVGVVNTYVSQNLGAGRPERAPAYAWNALWLAVAAWGFLIAFGIFAIPVILSGGASDGSPRLAAMQIEFAQILLFGSVLTLSTRAIAQYFYGMHKPMVVLVAAVTGNLVNLFANIVLVFGVAGLGIPKLGVAGAAYGTLIGTAVELSIPLAIFLGPKWNALYKTRAAWRPSVPHLRDIFKIGWAGSITTGNELICWALFMQKLAGSFGIEHNMAGWIALRYMHLSFMPSLGLSFAVSSVVGRAIGAGKPEVAARKVRYGVLLAVGYMVLCGGVFVLCRHELVSAFIAGESPPEQVAKILHIGTGILVIAAIFQLFDGIGITLIGALRGAGDTAIPGVVTIILAWSLIIGLGYGLTKFAPQLESRGPWIGAAVYIIALGIFLGYRWMSGAWRNIKLLEHSGPVMH